MSTTNQCETLVELAMAEPHKRRRHPKFRKKYRVRNWTEYEKSLRDRGDITIWVTPEGVAAWTAPTKGKRGAQEVYSDLAIETALTLRLLFHLPLRQTEGFLRAGIAVWRLAWQVEHQPDAFGAQSAMKVERQIPRRAPLGTCVRVGA